jgi:hypothetical protein
MASKTTLSTMFLKLEAFHKHIKLLTKVTISSPCLTLLLAQQRNLTRARLRQLFVKQNQPLYMLNFLLYQILHVCILFKKPSALSKSHVIYPHRTSLPHRFPEIDGGESITEDHASTPSM